MPTVAIYRCPKCEKEYRPLEAGALRFLCCGMPLERMTGPTKRKPQGTTAPFKPPHQGGKDGIPIAGAQEFQVLEIIPPRENTVDALAVRNLLATMAAPTPFSLEIAGDGKGRHFLLRAGENTLTYVRQQLQAVYGQASFRPLAPELDPARADDRARANAKVVLEHPVYLPLLTFERDDFQEADPMRALLGAYSSLQEGERVLSQIILSPAPRRWARRYVGSMRQVERTFSGEAMNMGLYLHQTVSLVLVITACAMCLWTLFAFLQRHWPEFIAAGSLAALSIVGVGYLFKLWMDRANVDPVMVKQKTLYPAYDVAFRLSAVAPTPDRANTLLRQLAMAYRQFDLTSGNALIARQSAFNPRVVAVEPYSWWDELRERVMRLNVAELASLWHLPVGEDVQLIEHTQAKRLLPLPADVGKGILVGHSQHQGQTIPVHLPTESLWHHVFMVAKTQKGKSTLMAHLAAETMRYAMRTALVVIDPHGDLARSLLGLVPRDRASDVVYIDFSDTQQVVGLNLLDMSHGRNADVIVSNIVHVGELIWSDYWGPRMEDALRMAVRTLLAANEILARRQEKQFTLIDIPALFELPNFRHRLLEQFVSDSEILQWWSGYFERLYESLRMDVINPVLTKIHRFSTHTVVRNIVGQSSSTVNFRELLDERRILLVNTATGVIGPDAGGLLGAVLVDYINFAVREQMAIPDPKARARVVVVVDEFQSIPGVDYPGLLAELQKMGANFILATQALGQLKAISKDLHASIFSNIATLFVFQTSAEDADFLRHELDDTVTATDIINLADYTCYLKTQVGHERLPVMHVETLPPDKGNPVVVEQVLGQMTRYTRPANVVASERSGFQQQWYGREMNLVRQTISLKGNESPPPAEGNKNEKPRRETRAHKIPPSESPPATQASSGGERASKGSAPDPGTTPPQNRTPSIEREKESGQGGAAGLPPEGKSDQRGNGDPKRINP